MSLLNFIGAGRKTVAPVKPVAATANPEAVHAQLSHPSRQAASAPAVRSSTRRPSHSPSPTTHHPVSPSRSTLSPAASQLSLVESLDDETLSREVPSHPVSSASLWKAPALLEQDWMDVGKDSSDEDVFLSDSDHDTVDHQK